MQKWGVFLNMSHNPEAIKDLFGKFSYISKSKDTKKIIRLQFMS